MRSSAIVIPRNSIRLFSFPFMFLLFILLAIHKDEKLLSVADTSAMELTSASHPLEGRPSRNVVFINYITLNSSISSLFSFGTHDASSSHHYIMTSLNSSLNPSLLLSLSQPGVMSPSMMTSLNDSDLASLTPQMTQCEAVYNKNLGGTAGQVLLFFIKAIIALVGFGGNYLVIVVYKRKRGCHPSEFLILSIAIVDFLFCTLNLSFLVFLCMSPILGYISNESICTFFGCFINSASYTFTTFSSLFLICVITINRYVAICKPHDYTTYFSETAVRTLISLAFLFGTVSCVSPGLYCYGNQPARLASDVYWYSAKLLLNLANCVTMVIVYIKVLLQFRDKQRKLIQRRAATLSPPVGGVGGIPQGPMQGAHEGMRLTMAEQSHMHNGVITTHTVETHIDTSDPPGVVNNSPSASPYLLLPNKEPPANNHHGCIIQAPQVGVNGTGTGLSAPPPSASYLRRCSDVISVMQDDLGESRFGGPNGSGRSRDSTKNSAVFKRRRSCASGSKEKRVTMTLFAISILYIIANLPATVLECIVWYHAEVLHEQIKIIPNLNDFSYLVYLLYFDLNPFIYFASNSFYRTQVIAMIKNPSTIFACGVTIPSNQ